MATQKQIYQLDRTAFRASEQELVQRIITGSGKIYRAVAALANPDPKLVEAAGQLNDSVRADQEKAAKAGKSPSPSRTTRLICEAIVDMQSARHVAQIAEDLSPSHLSTERSYLMTNGYGPVPVPVDLRRVQHPNVMVIACADSRVDPVTLLNAQPGQVLINRSVAGGIEDPDEDYSISLNVKMAIELALSKKVKNILIITHGKCGGIETVDQLAFMDTPPNKNLKSLWRFSQKKRGCLEDLHKKGQDYYLGRINTHNNYEGAHDQKMQALEIASGVRDLELIEHYVNDVADEPVTVSLVYMDLRTMNPHMLAKHIENEGGGEDWRLVPLTDHPELPEIPEQHQKVPALPLTCDC